MILLKGGRVIDPQSGFDEIADVLVREDKVADICEHIDIEAVRNKYNEEIEVYNCEGCVVGPGLVDIHVHFRDPGFTYKEDIESGAKAAAAGGYTSVVLMANTKPAVDNEDTLQYVLDKGKATDINVYTCANITKGLAGKELTDFGKLLGKGAAGFTDDGIPILDEGLCESAMLEAVKYDTILSFHEEDPKYITNNGINRGSASEYYGIGGSDREAEISMVKRDVDMAVRTGAKINIQHISSKEAVDIVRNAKKECNNVFAEATPHHIALTEEAAIEFGTLAKMNPPLREEEDRKAIIEGLRDDTIDVIATDHAPHSKEEKEKKITDAPSGIIGLETALLIAYEELILKEKFTFLKVFCKMSYNPARMYGINAGMLAKNEIADIVVLDIKSGKKYEKAVSKSQNSPFLGRTFDSKIALTIRSGKVIYKDL